jgi:AcrR family transcriptional regulator
MDHSSPHAGSGATSAHDATRRALLNAAADVFAEVGFRQATVRDICSRAGANVAAVNYHFGDKESLYGEVLAEQNRIALDLHPVPTPKPGTPPELRLEEFIRSFLQRVLSEELSARHGRMMAREMVEPTRALDRLVAESIRPTSAALFEILRDLVGPRASNNSLRLLGMSVVGQILFYCHCQPVLQRLFPDTSFNSGQLEQLTRHITDFSLAGVRGLQTGKAEKSRVPRPKHSPRRKITRSRS